MLYANESRVVRCIRDNVRSRLSQLGPNQPTTSSLLAAEDWGKVHSIKKCTKLVQTRRHKRRYVHYPLPILSRTAVRVRDRGRELETPLVGGAMMRRLAIKTTSLPLNFFSSSRTNRCWILWKDLSSRKGT